jgi:MoxR-like ATPase
MPLPPKLTGVRAAAGRSRTEVAVGPDLAAVLEIAYRARRPVLIEGPTGVGKSDIVRQVAQKLGIGCQVLDLSLLEPPDLVGLPTIADGRTTYAVPRSLPVDGVGILLLEELNRAERFVQQPALQLLTARRLHEYEVPEGWSLMAAVNPEDSDYCVTPMDPALRARFLTVRVRADRASWLAWAEASDVHRAVLNLARQHDKILDDVPPRTWAYVSDALGVLTPAEAEDERLLKHLLGGTLPEAWLDLLLLERASWADVGNLPYELLHRYHLEPKLPAAVAELTSQGRTDVLDAIARQVASIVRGAELGRLMADGGFDLQAFERLVQDLPGDQREQVQEAFGENPLAIGLLDVRPEDVLKGVSRKPTEATIRGWLATPAGPHRVRALVTALCARLERSRDVASLRRNTGARAALRDIVALAGDPLSAPLRRTLQKLEIEPVVEWRTR